MAIIELCRHPRCRNAKPCEVHGKRRDDRPNSTSRGYDSRWRNYRKRFLREHPLCVMCQKEGKVTPATEVDHIKRVTGPDDPLFWEPSNHQALDGRCHRAKTATEQARVYR